MHKMWLLILNHLMFGLIPMFAAGAVAELGVGGGSGNGTDSGDNGAEGASGGEAEEIPEGAESGDGADGDDTARTSADDQRQADQDSAEGDGRTLSAEWKKLLADTKAISPKLAAELRTLKFGHMAFRKEFPGGLKEVRELKTTLDEIGGRDGFQGVKSELDEWNALDQQFVAGDPAFVAQIAQNEPESFAKLAPHVINKFAEVDSEGYQRVLCGIFDQTMQSAGVLNQLWMIRQALSIGKPDEALKLLDGIDGWAKQIKEIAATTPKAKTEDPRAKEFEQKEQKLRDQQEKIFNQSLTTKFVPWRNGLIEKELKQYTKGAKIDPERLEIFCERVIRKTAAINDKDPNYRKTFDRHYQAQDEEGLMKFMKERFETQIADAVKAVYKILPMGPAIKQAAKPNSNATDTAKPVEKGWVRLTAPPKPELVDNSKTSFEMKFKNQAVLKDGRKVTW